MVVPRSWKHADAVAATREFLSHRPPRQGAIRALMKELISEDPFARRCAADLARRVSESEPGILSGYSDVLIDLALEIRLDEWPARGHVLLAAASNTTSRTQRLRLAPLARAMIEDDRNALRAIALEAFAVLAAAEPELREEGVVLLENARREGTAAMRARARRMLVMLMDPKKAGPRSRTRR